MSKVRVGVFLGGASEEREISLASGLMIAEHLPKDRYDVRLFDTLALMANHPGLSPEFREKARLLRDSGVAPALPSVADSGVEAVRRRGTLPVAMRQQLERAEALAAPATNVLSANQGTGPIDVAFLALHGKYGEDGTLQGFLDLIGVPYTGSGTLASALAMDKVMAKKILEAERIPTPHGCSVRRGASRRPLALMEPPLVVKPSKQGSSVGMTMVQDRAQLDAAIDEGLRHDDEVLVEERIMGTEVTVGVLGRLSGDDAVRDGVLVSGDVEALPVVEIVPKREFFDYSAKYDPDQCEEICPARIASDISREAQKLAIAAHRALRCRGYSRTDIILSSRGPVVLEVNTLPGMTINSLLPKAAQAAHISFGELLHRIIQLAMKGGE